MSSQRGPARESEALGEPWTVPSARALVPRRRVAATSRLRSVRRPHLVVGGVVVGLVVLAAALAPVLAPASPDLVRPELRLRAPSPAYPLGTDALGRDMLSRVLYGARIAVLISGLTALVAAVPGTALGLAVGYRKGWLEPLLSRVMDAWLAFPGLLLAVVLVARMGPSLTPLVVALGIVGVPSYYRLARNSTISARHAGYVEGAWAIGASDVRILACHVLPNIASPIVVLTSLRMGTVLLAASGLGFIGLGVQPPHPEWGALLNSGRDYLDTAWWLAVFPGLAITLSVLGLNLLGDGLRDALAMRGRGLYRLPGLSRR